MESINVTAIAPIVARIVVTGLFGQYNYRLPTEGRLSNAAILYGDNGSGKTTLLNLVFNMLSPADNRGHRTNLARVPFRRFAIELSDGTVLSAARQTDRLIGGYRLEVRKRSTLIAHWDYEPGPRSPWESTEVADSVTGQLVITRGKKRPDSDEVTYLGALKDLNLGVYLLSADRQISSDSLAEGREEQDIRRMLPLSELRSAKDLLERTRELALNQALQNAWRWIGRQAVVGTNVGSDSVNSIYAEIVRRISRSKKGGAARTDSKAQKSKIESTLLDIAQRSSEYARYEFMAPLKAEEMIASFQQATGKTAQVVISVLEPYIEGAEARLKALRDIFHLTETFVTTLNGFYAEKNIEFGLTRGFLIQNSAGAELKPEHLSSGEQQLLLLFCHTLIARDQPSLFIIDEPELSLNVKWQRILIQALLNVASQSHIQFLFASHSIELVSQHRERVVQLRRE